VRCANRLLQMTLLWVIATGLFLAGCSGAKPIGTSSDTQIIPTPAVAPPATVQAAPDPAPPAPDAQQSTISPDQVAALIREMGKRPFTLTWHDDGTQGRAGLGRNGDRYFLPGAGQGIVQRGLRTWVVNVDSKGSLTWGQPYAGSVLQLPFLEHLRSHPETWGIEEMLSGVKVLRKSSAKDETELWTAELPDGAIDVAWQGFDRSLRQLRVWVRREGLAQLPVRWEAMTIFNGTSMTMEGEYDWAEPLIPAAPNPPGKERELGLFNVWLGETRAELEPIRFDPTERKKEADGSAWSLAEGRAIKYDKTGKVTVLSQTEGELINGLAVGDDATAVVRFLGPVADANAPVLSYRFPRGSRLEVHLQHGKVEEFRAVGVGQP